MNDMLQTMTAQPKAKVADQPVLTVRELEKRFGGLRATAAVSFDVADKAITALIGPNGAGKTTLMRVISGLIRPTRGSITMQGADVLATAAHRIVSLGIAHVPRPS